MRSGTSVVGWRSDLIKASLAPLALACCVLAGPHRGLAITQEEQEFGFYGDRLHGLTATFVLNEDLQRRLNEVGQRVTRTVGRSDLRYTFRIVNQPLVNAYAGPGGFVYVNTGLLDILESEDELAAVLAHEIVHTTEGHVMAFVEAANRRRVMGIAARVILTLALAAASGAAVASLPTGQQHPQTTASALQLEESLVNVSLDVGGAAGYAISASMINGYGKRQELEADRLAVHHLHAAGYDPNALVSVLGRLIDFRNRLSVPSANYVSSLINAEPGLEERSKRIREEIARYPMHR